MVEAAKIDPKVARGRVGLIAVLFSPSLELT